MVRGAIGANHNKSALRKAKNIRDSASKLVRAFVWLAVSLYIRLARHQPDSSAPRFICIKLDGSFKFLPLGLGSWTLTIGEASESNNSRQAQHSNGFHSDSNNPAVES